MEFLQENPFFLIQAFLALIFLIAGVILYVAPPKKMNHWYGYRTKQSMSSQAKWDAAQRFGAIGLLVLSIIFGVTAMLDVFLFIPEQMAVIWSFILLIPSVLIMIIIIENQLKYLDE